MDACSYLDINLDAIHHNVTQLRGCCGPEVRFCGVLKADGYGLGARAIAPTLVRAGASMLAVFSPGEAESLLDVDRPILVLMPVGEGPLSSPVVMALRAGRMYLTIHQASQLAAVERLARSISAVIAVHLKIDTGLHRGGCDPRDTLVLIRAIQRSPHLRLAGMMTHFAEAASSEPATTLQMKHLHAVLESAGREVPTEVVVHASGTCGLLRGSAFHADMVRVGLGWTGHLPPNAPELSACLSRPLRPAIRWTSHLSLVREVAQGARVGYGGQWTAPRASRIGWIPVGYADGYPPDAATPHDGGPGLCVGIGSPGDQAITAPVVGAVNMDQMAVDLTEVDRPVEVGEPVHLISSNSESPMSLTAIAARLGRSCHMLLVQIQAHVPRRYRGAGGVQVDALPGSSSPCVVAG